MAGYAGRILRINLTDKTITSEDLDLDTAKRFVGGRGLGTYFLSKESSSPPGR